VPPLKVGPDHKSSDCDDGRHIECGHRLGNVGHLFRKVETPQITLCQCDCHSSCPIASDEAIPESVWYQQCSCPGAEESKQQHRAWAEERATRKRTTQEICSTVDATGKGRAEIRAELELAYRRRGIEPNPYELDGISSAMEAASGPSLLAVPRMLGSLGRLVSNAIKDIRRAS
jgi:hypothetical protein